MCKQIIEAVELNFGINIIRENKHYKLPTINPNKYFLEDGATVELYVLGISSYWIESFERPMRLGKIYGSRIFLNTVADKHNLNPKFVYDAENKVWVIMNAGYVCFAEMEVECQNVHKLYGGIDA